MSWFGSCRTRGLPVASRAVAFVLNFADVMILCLRPEFWTVQPAVGRVRGSNFRPVSGHGDSVIDASDYEATQFHCSSGSHAFSYFGMRKVHDPPKTIVLPRGRAFARYPGSYLKNKLTPCAANMKFVCTPMAWTE